jgi:acetyl esterase/lipase
VIKLFLPLLALLLAGASLLTLVRAPDWMWIWKLTILVGEFSQWLVLLVLGIALLAGFRTDGAARVLALTWCALSLFGLLRPGYLARRIAEKLPAEMSAAFGGGSGPGPAFEIGRLYRIDPSTPAIQVTTEVFARPDGQELKVDCYAPLAAAAGRDAGARRPAPCIVVIHGGGWDGGDRKQLAAWNYRWAARGYAVAAVSYRLAPRFTWPAQREDVLSAIAWLKAHAGQLGLDPTRLVLLGRSAGGQIASAVGYGAGDPAIRGVIALYAPQDMPFVWSVSREDDALNSAKLMRQYLGGPPTEERRERYATSSGQGLARKDSPPTLLLHGVLDTLSWDRHSDRLTARLAELHVPHYYLRLPWATHGFDFNLDGPGGQLADYAIGHFLTAVVP